MRANPRQKRGVVAGLRSSLDSMAVGFLILVSWAVVSEFELFPTYILPSLRLVFRAFANVVFTGEIFYHIYYSLIRVGSGIFLAAGTAIPLGLLLGWSRTASRFFEPILHVIRQIPPLAWIPFALVWFKGGVGSAIFIVFIGAFFPILINTISGVHLTQHGLIEVGQILGCNGFQLFKKVVVPSATPSILIGFRISIGIGWACVVAGEYFGYRYGLGALILSSYEVLRTDRMIVGMFFIGIIGFGIDHIFRIMENRLTRWTGR